jgi:hypothetical protein
MHSFSRSVGAICAVAVNTFFAMNLGAASERGEVRNSAQLNCGARIECTMPGSANQSSRSSVVIMSDDTISCPFDEGDTTFVVALPKSGAPERLKFVNQNVDARGTLRIAVSNEALAPNSARWTQVDGDVSFRDKRRFNVSVVGVEAKYVRVTFSVERAARVFTLALKDFQPARHDLFHAYFNRAPTSFSDNLATPLIAGLNP